MASRRSHNATLRLTFATAIIRGAFFEYSPRLVADFYGVRITFNSDGTTTTSYHGGFRPRPMDDDELRPWLLLVEHILERERRRVLGFGSFVWPAWWG